MSLWAAGIFASSSRVIFTTEFVPAVGSRLPDSRGTEHFGSFWAQYGLFFVKGWHFTEYTLLTLLAWIALREVKPRMASAITLCAILAMTDEFHQTFVPGRGGNLRDVMIDCTGVLFAAALISFFSRRTHLIPWAVRGVRRKSHA